MAVDKAAVCFGANSRDTLFYSGLDISNSAVDEQPKNVGLEDKECDFYRFGGSSQHVLEENENQKSKLLAKVIS